MSGFSGPSHDTLFKAQNILLKLLPKLDFLFVIDIG